MDTLLLLLKLDDYQHISNTRQSNKLCMRGFRLILNRVQGPDVHALKTIETCIFFKIKNYLIISKIL